MNQLKMSAKQFVEALKTYQSDEELKKYKRYFKLGESDIFMGVRMGQVFALAKAFIDMSPDEIEKLLESPIHEVRAGGCSIMAKQATRKKTPESRRKELYELYLRRHDRINNWDLVDLGAYKVVGSYLFDFDKPRAILYRLARSKDVWERRTSIVSTLYFIGKGDVDDAFKIAKMLLKDDQDLIHKATGWALRAAGDSDRSKLLSFLDQHAATMPRTALRYAIEHLDKEQRSYYLGMKNNRNKQSMATPKPKIADNTEAVNAFMDKLDHPLKQEVQAVREIILNTHSGIKEQIKWNAPSFGYTDYIVTFNLRATDRIHLVFHNPHIAKVKSAILEGDYADRRMAYFSDMKDVKAKKSALEKVVTELIRLMDEQ